MNQWIRGGTAALMLVAAAACGGDSNGPDDDDDNNPGQGTMSATVDGISWTANLAVQATYSGGTLAFAGTGQASGKQIQLNFSVPFVNTTGPYPLGTGLFPTVVITIDGVAYVASLAGGTGSLNVQTLTATSASGTFTVTGIGSGGVGSKSATGGSFSVTF